MLVAEQFDRLVAPIEYRYRKEEIVAWFAAIGFELVGPPSRPRLACDRPSSRTGLAGLFPSSCPPTTRSHSSMQYGARWSRLNSLWL